MRSPLLHQPCGQRAVTPGEGLALFVLLALLFATLPFNGIIAARRLLLLLFVGVAAHALLRRRALPALPLPVLGWFALAPLSLLWSENRALSASELIPDALYPFLGMLAATALLRTPRTLAAALGGLFAGAAAVVAAGLWQAGGQASYDWQALAHGHGQFTTYLVMLLPFLLLALVEALRVHRAGLAVLLALLLCGALLAGFSTVNRMFWLSALVVLLVLCAGIALRREYAALRGRLLAAAALIGAAIAAAFAVAVRLRPANVIGVPGPGAAGLADNPLLATFTGSERFEMWRFWLGRIPEHPLLGIGFGYDMPRLVFLPDKPAHWHELLFAHAHNLLLDIAIRLGMLGLALFIAALAALALLFWRALRSPDHGAALAGMAGLALLAGTLSKNLTDDFMTRGPLFIFWLLVGLLLGALQGRRPA